MEIDFEKRVATDARHQIGDYILGIDESWRLWKVRSRVDGKPVPKPLSGRWTEPAEFEAALAEYNRKGDGEGSEQ